MGSPEFSVRVGEAKRFGRIARVIATRREKRAEKATSSVAEHEAAHAFVASDTGAGVKMSQ